MKIQIYKWSVYWLAWVPIDGPIEENFYDGITSMFKTWDEAIDYARRILFNRKFIEESAAVSPVEDLYI